jgi:hypothetical protein
LTEKFAFAKIMNETGITLGTIATVFEKNHYFFRLSF